MFTSADARKCLILAKNISYVMLFYYSQFDVKRIDIVLDSNILKRVSPFREWLYV